MKKLNSKEIKKIIFGVLLTDGSVLGKRFSIYCKEKEMVDKLFLVLSDFPNLKITIRKVFNERFGSEGYRLWTTNSPYFEKIRKIFYPKEKKTVTKYIADRMDFQAFAYAWMCDGYLEHQKNRKENKIQNRGWFCLEGFESSALLLLVNRLKELGVNSRLSSVDWGNGFRIQISGTDLQVFIDKIYPYILKSFIYKTELYYKSDKYVLPYLSNTEHIIKYYNDVEDIVRHS
jgi:hypothetical protein